MFLRFNCLVLLIILLTACTSSGPTPMAATAVDSDSDPAARINPKAAAINTQLGMNYLQDGQIERARSKLLLALIQGPNYQPAYDAMAYFMEKTGQGDQAKQYYQKSLALNGRAGSAQNNYGAYLCRQKDYGGAIKHFMLAVHDPAYLTPADAYENAGLCAELIPDFAEAKQFFQQALQQDPLRASSILELARINYKQGNYQEAYNYLKNYDKLTPSGADSLLLSVQINKKLGNLDQAASSALLLKNQFPESKEAKQLKGSQLL